MRYLILIAFVLAPHLAAAQAGSGSADGSAESAPAEKKPPLPPPPAGAADLRKTCADAMNADPSFAQQIVETINADTARQHFRAADAIAKNEKHVLLAYGAMWAIAAVFLIFMWRRQQGLKTEIAQLKRDLEAATK
jgi:hypothetical protein